MAWVEQCGNRSWRVRFRRDDGTIGAIRGFATKTAATEHANTLEADQREGRFLDPAAGKITLSEWSQDWLEALDVAIRTEDVYRSLLRRHILPRWGDHGLVDISGIKAAAWAKELRDRGYSATTVTAVTKLLSLLLADATEERLIAANPIRARRRGRRRTERRTERLWATPSEVLAIADNAARLPNAGPAAAVLIVTAAWTGDPVGRDRRAATPQHPPRPPRRDRLSGHRPAHGGDDRVQPRGRARPTQDRRVRPHHHRCPRSWSRCCADIWTRMGSGSCSSPPAGSRTATATSAAAPCARPWTAPCDRARATVQLAPVKPGLTFHGLRHGHKTWMIADGVPEVAQARRLGHILGDRIRETYSHVAAEVDTRLLAGLQDRWDKAVADSRHHSAGGLTCLDPPHDERHGRRAPRQRPATEPT